MDTGFTLGKLNLVNFLPDDPIILDIGAHDGSDSEELSLLFPRGHIWSFEAQSDLYCILKRRLSGYANATPIHAAVCDFNGVITFHQSSGDSHGSGSILLPSAHLESHPNVIFDERDQELVPAIALQTFLTAAQISRVDLIWLDLQGAELRALASIENLLSRVTVIYTEVSSTPLYQGATTYSEIRSFLSQFGFVVEREFIPEGSTGEGNVLFINNR